MLPTFDDAPAVTLTNSGATLRLYLHNVLETSKPFKIVQIFTDDEGERAPTVEQEGTDEEEMRLALALYVDGLTYEGWTVVPQKPRA